MCLYICHVRLKFWPAEFDWQRICKMKLNKWNMGCITLLRTALFCISGLSDLKRCSTKNGPGCRIGHPAPSIQDVGKKPSPEYMQIAGYCKYPVYRKDWMKKRARGKIGCEKTGRWTKGKPHPTQAGWELGAKRASYAKQSCCFQRR